MPLPKNPRNRKMFTLPKTERLCSKKQIEDLYLHGQRLRVFPYHVCWMRRDSDAATPPAQVLISVSKKRFHHAVDRNRVKRLTRECYRLHKPQLNDLLQQAGCSLTLSISYAHNEILDYSTLFHKMDKIIDRLKQALDGES